jgi:hypothetical protein
LKFCEKLALTGTALALLAVVPAGAADAPKA